MYCTFTPSKWQIYILHEVLHQLFLFLHVGWLVFFFSFCWQLELLKQPHSHVEDNERVVKLNLVALPSTHWQLQSRQMIPYHCTFITHQVNLGLFFMILSGRGVLFYSVYRRSEEKFYCIQYSTFTNSSCCCIQTQVWIITSKYYGLKLKISKVKFKIRSKSSAIKTTKVVNNYLLLFFWI